MTELKYRLLVGAAIGLFLLMAIGLVSVAQQAAPAIRVDAAAVVPGAPLTVHVTGFVPGERVALALSPLAAGSEALPLGEFVALEDGGLEAVVVVPARWEDGSPVQPAEAALVATSADGTTTARTPLPVR
ncbi:MAG: hypothetical protein Kow0077_14370 [Anaerolineae bacterium]